MTKYPPHPIELRKKWQRKPSLCAFKDWGQMQWSSATKHLFNARLHWKRRPIDLR